MENQLKTTEFFGPSKKHGFPAVWAVLITVAVCLVLAGAGYYYLNSKYKKEKANLNDSVTKLTVELNALKKAAASTSSTASSSQTTASNSSDLLTYTNNTYGYQFQYPKNLNLIDYLYNVSTGAKESYGKIVVLSPDSLPENSLKSESEIAPAYFMVTAEDQQYGLSELSSNISDGSGTLTDVTVDRTPGWKIVYTQPSLMFETYSTSIYVNHGSYGIAITWKNSDAAGTHNAAIDAIVASFKWL